MMSEHKTKHDDDRHDDDNDFVGPFAFTSPRAMIFEGVVRLLVEGDEAKAKEGCKQYRLSLTEARAKAREIKRAKKAEARAAAAAKAKKPAKKPKKPADEEPFLLASGHSDPNEGVPWGASPPADAYFLDFDHDVVEAIESMSDAMKSASAAGLPCHQTDEVAGHEIPGNAIATVGSEDFSYWWESLSSHVEEVGGDPEYSSDRTLVPTRFDEDGDDVFEPAIAVHWWITRGVHRRLLERLHGMTDRLQRWADEHSGHEEKPA